MTARLAHSASSVAVKCDVAYALQYLEGIREPEIDYADILSGRLKATFDPKGPHECSYKQRGAALGKAGHSVYESYFDGGHPDWTSLPGQVAASGARYYPLPSRCDSVEVEAPIGDVRIRPADDDSGKPQWALDADGILWTGFRDLTVTATQAELRRLGIVSPSGVVLLDHKFTSNVDLYALTPEGLFTNVQACIYALDVHRVYAIDPVPARWVYHETRWVHAKPGQYASTAKPVDVSIPVDHARAVVSAAADRARHLNEITSWREATPNTDVCCDFSGRPGEIGCAHHITKGGKCNVRLSVGRLIQARVGKAGKEVMAISAEAKAAFEKQKQDRLAALEGGAPGVKSDSDAPPPPPAAKKERKPRTPKPTATPAEAAPEAPPPRAEGKVTAILDLAQDLADAQSRVEAILERIAEASAS